MRFLPASDFVRLLYHVRETQRIHRDDLIRAAESLAESRLGAQSRSVQELQRLTIGTDDPLYEQFLQELTDNFQHILYGRDEDVIGIHIISYFIARSIPQLRDRPTSRRTPGTGSERGQEILANIAEIIPLSKQGSLLRAIVHNQAQTVVLGINQLTTGLFRALERFAQKALVESEREQMIAEHLLPHLPVYEILNTLRIGRGSSSAESRPLSQPGILPLLPCGRIATPWDVICPYSSVNCCGVMASMSMISSSTGSSIRTSCRPCVQTWRYCYSRTCSTLIPTGC